MDRRNARRGIAVSPTASWPFLLATNIGQVWVRNNPPEPSSNICYVRSIAPNYHTEIGLSPKPQIYP